MATQYSNKPIVTDGLVYALDFGNPKSYVSGSTTANSLKYDIITSASILTFGGATIPDLQNGLLKMVAPTSTTGSTIFFNTQFSDLVPSGDFTIQVVLNNTGSGTFITQGPSGTRFISTLSTTSTFFGWYINPLPYAQAGGSGGNYYSKSYPLQSRVQHLTYRYSSGSYDLFVNGVPVATSARYASVSTNTGNMTINGYGTLGLSLATLDIGNFYIYNRALTSDEIYSNYLIQAQRYGLPTTPKPYSIDENAYLFLSQSGITDPIITGSIDTFVRGLKANNLWDKMIAIYPFVGTGSVGVNLTGSHSWNLKDPTTAYYKLAFTGSWNGSTSGSAPSGSNTAINTGVLPYEYYPFKSDSNQHISILSYDTPTTSSYLMGTGMTEDLAISTLAGDYGTPAAAYSVRKVRTAYSGALMDVRRSLDNVTSSIGYVSNGDLDTGSLLTFVGTGPDDHGFVARWYDQSGNNRHASQTATGSQPLIVESGSIILDNTRPALSFNGTSHDITSSFGTTVTQPITVYSIYKPDITGSIHPVYSGNILNYIQGNKYISYAGATVISVQTASLNTVLNTTVFSGSSTYFNINSVFDTSGNAGTAGTSGFRIGAWTFGTTYYFTGKIQELVMYPSNQASVAAPVEYGINNYYNIYTQPTSSNWATSSFTIKVDSGSISGSLNNRLTSGIATSGPLGFITVSRTGSNSLTIAKNGVSSSFTVPASGALSTGLYLGAINNNGIALGNSPLNIEYASVGTGLTNAEAGAYTSLVYNFRNNFKGYDRDAVNFINALGTARSYLTLTQQYSINTLVTSLKSNRLWDKFQVMYPFIGGTATSHGFNLKDPRQTTDAFYMTFNGGTNNATGYSQNGNSSLFGLTNFNPSVNLLDVSSSHISLYVPILNTQDGYDFGTENAGLFGMALRTPWGQMAVGIGGVSATISPPAHGYFIGSRIGTTTVMTRYSGSTVVSGSGTGTTYNYPNFNAQLGSRGYGATNRFYSFLTIGSGLTVDESATLNTIVETYQASLSRQAGA
jgi:hypothetical protein